MDQSVTGLHVQKNGPWWQVQSHGGTSAKLTICWAWEQVVLKSKAVAIQTEISDHRGVTLEISCRRTTQLLPKCFVIKECKVRSARRMARTRKETTWKPETALCRVRIPAHCTWQQGQHAWRCPQRPEFIRSSQNWSFTGKSVLDTKVRSLLWKSSKCS